MQNQNCPPLRPPKPHRTNVVRVDVRSHQVKGNQKKSHLLWSELMDGFLIHSLCTQVLGGHQRVDNGFIAAQIKVVIDTVEEGCHIRMEEKNVRSRLKTLKKDYVEFHELLQVSGFGYDINTGGVTADASVWADYIAGKPDAGRMRGKKCMYYDELQIIFSNDTATGDNAISGADQFSPMNVTEEVEEVDVNDEPYMEIETQTTPGQETDTQTTAGQETDTQTSVGNTMKRKGQAPKIKLSRRRVNHQDECAQALTVIAESSKKIATAMELQVAVDS